MLVPASLICLLLSVAQVDSLSTQPAPLRRVHVPQNPSIRRLEKRNGLSKRAWSPQSPVHSTDQLRHSDTLLLRFQVDDEPVSLVVRPTEDLLHPDARINYHTLDPFTGQSSVRTEKLLRDDVRAYEGHVVKESEVWHWWNEEQAGVVRVAQEIAERTRGWARVVLPSGDSEGAWEGAFGLDGDLHTLMGLATYERVRHALDPAPPAAALVRRSRPGAGTLVMRNSDMHEDPSGPASCAHDNLEFNTNPSLNPVLLGSQHALSSSTLEHLSYFAHRKRQSTGNDVAGGLNLTGNFIGNIGSTNGCPKNRLVAYIGVAADCTYVSHYGSQSAARTQLLTNINSVSALYQQSFNVSIGAVELNVQDTTCPTQVDSSTPWNIGCPESGPSGLDLNDRLSVFSRWRGNKGGSDGAGLWHLMTNCSTGSEVGVAWLGQLCRVTASGGGNGVTSGTGVTAITRSEWQVMAHEIGHNFGAVHDCVSGCSLSGSCCPLSTSSCDSSSNFIMSPVSIRNVTTFSPCTVGNICSLMQSTTNTSCLATPGQRSVISLQQCGNGIIDEGEDCDPGQQSSSCCNPTTCKFVSGAVCDPLNSACCTSTCQLASSGVVCRPATDPRCDTAETCSGSSPNCPDDQHVSDGTSCGDNGLACAAGICTSRDLQCQQQGSSLNVTSACSLNTDSSCSVTCNDPRGGGQCVVLDSNFVDGTPCGYAGRCSNGSCQSGNFLDAAKSWYTRNLQISIPVTIIAGLIVLAILGGLTRCLLMRRRTARTAPSAAYYSGRNARMPPPMPGMEGSTDRIIPGTPDSPAPPAAVLARRSAPPPPVYGAPGLPPEPTMRSAHSGPSVTSQSRHSVQALPWSPTRDRPPSDPSSRPSRRLPPPPPSRSRAADAYGGIEQ